MPGSSMRCIRQMAIAFAGHFLPPEVEGAYYDVERNVKRPWRQTSVPVKYYSRF